ncbi:50S ribosomal protein L13 [Candidatus Beckwithbacteria bacterium]|nr:50S ribosomal protein L13 [Candidatus Beckwithbacteria bacterium]
MKTYATKQNDIKREWFLVDANGKVLGRLASMIAQVLIGKDKTNYVPYLDCGDYVVLTNVDKIVLTGRKAEQKSYYRHSGFPGGLKEITFKHQMEKDARKVIFNAVKGMLPKNKLRDERLKRLKVFVGDKHTYENQALKELK